MQTKTKFIIFMALVVVIVGGLGLYFSMQPLKPSKFDQFAKALKEKGAVFYGAFWCPHCQAQKAEFGNSKRYLPYVECSNPDQSQAQICIDNKIESYPTWTFKNGISLNSDKDPLVCEIKTSALVEPAGCNNRSSESFKTWIFSNYNFSIKSPIDPTKEGSTWKFPGSAQISGEVPITFLAEQIQFTLPQ